MVLSENIASEHFYNKYWEKAINELNIKYMKNDAEINFSMKDTVLKELELLLEWAMVVRWQGLAQAKSTVFPR